jgi:hypothetical protein
LLAFVDFAAISATYRRAIDRQKNTALALILIASFNSKMFEMNTVLAAEIG